MEGEYNWLWWKVLETQSVSFVCKSFLNWCLETAWKSGCFTTLPLSVGNSKWLHFHLFLSGWNVLHQFMLCLAPSLHKVRYNRDLWKQTQIHKNYPCQLCTILFTIFSILSAEFGDYDSPDISANYLEDFKVCPDQVSTVDIPMSGLNITVLSVNIYQERGIRIHLVGNNVYYPVNWK